MCGIFGIVSKENIDPLLVEKATDIMAHRGPDDKGVFILNNGQLKIGLGHRRLSIIDLTSAGHQPMCNEDKSIWIVYNGEIYNFQGLRQELETKGHIFKSRTDTEVVIHAYEEWQEDCLYKFSGMFAFAIWDNKQKIVFMARDRLGIKPLYYIWRGEKLLFASEIKSILQVPEVKAEIDRDGLFSLLLFLWVPDPKTMFKDILKLPAGHYAILKDGRFTIKQYWDIDVKPEEDKSETYFTEQLLELLQKTIKRQMISDVPIGLLLSGGLDSSTILAFMAQNIPGPVTTYTTTFSKKDKKFEAMPDDSIYAQLATQRFNANYHEIILEPSIVELLPKMVWHLDEPIADPAAINTYLISKSAKERGTTVLFSGMGGDELFGGYRKQLSASVAIYYRLLPEILRKQSIEYLLQKMPVANNHMGFRYLRWIKRFMKYASLPPIYCFIGNSAFYTPEEMKQLLNSDLKFDYSDSYPIKKWLEHFEMVKSADYINQMCYLDSKLMLTTLNLTYTDKAMMAASVEGRPPLIDDEIVDFAFRIPGRYKIRHFRQKHIFKKTLENILPKRIIERPKAPFGVPLRAWIRKELAPMIDSLLSEETVNRRGYFNYSYIQKIIEDDRTGREDNAHRLWALLTLEIWHRIFIDK